MKIKMTNALMDGHGAVIMATKQINQGVVMAEARGKTRRYESVAGWLGINSSLSRLAAPCPFLFGFIPNCERARFPFLKRYPALSPLLAIRGPRWHGLSDVTCHLCIACSETSKVPAIA